MPILGLGTWDLRGPSGYRAILSALTCGYRLIDTAKMYANEDIVGKACKDSNISREELFITTKFSGSYASYEGVRRGIDESISLFNVWRQLHVKIITNAYSVNIKINK